MTTLTKTESAILYRLVVAELNRVKHLAQLASTEALKAVGTPDAEARNQALRLFDAQVEVLTELAAKL